MRQPALTIRRWTRAEYDRLGVLDREPVELIGGQLYARAGIADYWILNLADRVLEVYREPVHDLATRYGWRYLARERLGVAEVASPLAFPSVRVAVRALFA